MSESANDADAAVEAARDAILASDLTYAESYASMLDLLRRLMEMDRAGEVESLVNDYFGLFAPETDMDDVDA